MSYELWIAFVAASVVLLAIPGATITVVLGYALSQGRGAAAACVPGVVLGDFTAMTLSLLGAGAVLATSATLFTALKIAGAVYLVWLGIKMWRAEPEIEPTTGASKSVSKRAMFWNCYVVTALNPKDILFFVAFVPQFINPAEPVLIQFVILEATFLVMVGINIALWTLTAGHLSSSFANRARLKMMNRVGGACLIGAGLLTTAAKRA